MAVYINITNPPLEDFESTLLSSNALTNATVLNVFSGVGFRTNNILLVGDYGEEQAEIVRTHATTLPSNTQVTLSAGLRFPHSTNTPISLMPFDKFRVYQSNDGGLTFFLADTIDIRPDKNITVYVSSATVAAKFKLASFNSLTGLEGTTSDVVDGIGLNFAVVGTILDRVYDLYTDPNQKFIKSDDSIINHLNEAYFDMWTRMSGLGQGYAVKRTGTITDPDVNMIPNQSIYNQLSDMVRPVKIAMDYSNSGKFATARPYDPLLKGTEDEYSDNKPGYALYHDTYEIDPKGRANGKIRFWYVFMPAPITSVTDRPRLPAVDLTTKTLIDFCIARVYEKAYKPERAAYFLQAYENGVTAWLSAISKRRGDWPDKVHSFSEGLEDGSGVIY